MSLKLAQRLKELGVKQESVFYWYRSGDGKEFVDIQAVTTGIASAFTVAELIELLGTKFGVLERFDKAFRVE